METQPQPDNQNDFIKKPVLPPEVQVSTFRPINERPLLTREPESGFKAFYRTNKYYLWAILLGIGMISVLSYFAFRKGPDQPPVEANVSIKVSGPETVPSGGEVLYTVNLENKEDRKLTGVKLEVVYPEGVSYLGSDQVKADNLSGTSFTVPDFPPGVSPTIFIKARVTGGINETKQVKLKLRYKLANFNSEFSKEQSYAIRVIASDLAFEITGPTTTNNGQLIAYTLKYENNSKNEIKSGQVVFAYPAGFEYGASTPEPSQGKNIWTIPTLPVGAKGTIEIQGIYRNAQPGESRTISAQFLILGNNGQQFAQAEAQLTTALSSVPLLVTQELDNNSEQIANPGDTLSFNIRYQNNASVAVNGVTIYATLDSKALDLSTLQSEGGQVNNNVITWNAASVSALENLAPSESGSIKFSVRVKNPATKDATKELTVVSTIKVKAQEYDFFPGNTVTVKIASPGTLTAAASFSSGAMPPQVGKTTSYKIRLSLKNSSNDYSDGLLTAFIPLGPSGFDTSTIAGTEAGKVQYDPTTGKLTWNVGALPSYSGSFKPAKTLEFVVRLSPSSSQANTAPILVKTISFTAKDTFTAQNITLETDDITTSDAGGDSYGQGQVIE